MPVDIVSQSIELYKNNWLQNAATLFFIIQESLKSKIRLHLRCKETLVQYCSWYKHIILLHPSSNPAEYVDDPSAWTYRLYSPNTYLWVYCHSPPYACLQATLGIKVKPKERILLSAQVTDGPSVLLCSLTGSIRHSIPCLMHEHRDECRHAYEMNCDSSWACADHTPVRDAHDEEYQWFLFAQC